MPQWLRKYWLPSILALAIVSICVWIVISSEAFQQCIQHSYYESSDYEPKKSVAFLFGWVEWRKACTGTFLKENGEAITAFFTLVLAISTIFLWEATRKAARIAQSALTDLEAPFVGLRVIECGISARWTSETNCDIIQSWTALTFGFVNYGRTPAVLLELKDKIQVLPKKQMPPLEWPANQTKIYPYGVLIGPDKMSDESMRLFDNYVTRDEFDALGRNESDLYLLGVLKYRDIFSSIFEMGFCAVFNRDTSRFMMKGGDAYNYCRKISGN